MRFMTQIYIVSAIDSHNARIKGPRKIILLYSYTKQATIKFVIPQCILTCDVMYICVLPKVILTLKDS
jgi:hypothetical protein